MGIVDVAQSINSSVETFFYGLGMWTAKHAKIVLPLAYCMIVFSIGLGSPETTDDIYDLWVNRNSPVHNERDFIEEFFETSAARSEFLLGESPNRDGANIMNAEALNAYLEIAYRIEHLVHVPFEGQDIYYQDICRRYAAPNFMQAQGAELPCNKFSILDCFFEGGYAHTIALPNDYIFKPSFNDPDTDLGAVIGAGCTQYVSSALPLNFIAGGTEQDESGAVTYIASFQGIFDVASDTEFARRYYNTENPTDDQLDTAKKVIRRWESAYANFVEQVDDEFSDHLSFAYFTGRSSTDLVSQAANADTSLVIVGFFIMIIYAALSLLRLDKIKSRLLVGIGGVLLVIVSVAASLGLAAWFGVLFDATIIQVLPFLALGLGVDDMFVLAHSYSRKPGWSVEETTANTMKTAGASITLTSVTNAISFAIAYGVVLLPSVSNFSAAASLVVTLNYFIIVFGFTALLTLDGYRQEAGRMDMLFCVVVDKDHVQSIPPKLPMAEQEMQPTNTADLEGGEGKMRRKSSVGHLVHVHSKAGHMFGTFLSNKIVKVVVLVVFFAYFGYGIYGCTQVRDGLPLQDIVPSDSFGAPFLRLREDFYGSFNSFVVVGMDRDGNLVEGFDFANNLQNLVAVMEALSAELTYFIEAENLQIDGSVWIYGFNEFSAQQDPQSVGEDGFVLPERFNEMLGLYLDSDSSLTTRDQLILDDEGNLVTTRLQFYLEGLTTTEQFVFNIQQTRDILDRYQDLPIFPDGFPYQLYEQYFGIRDQLTDGLIFVGIGVGIASLFFLFDPRATLIMMFVIAMIIVEVYGTLDAVGLKVNGVTVVNIVMAVGVSVEFTAHICRSFMVAKGSRDHRMRSAMEDMTIPVINGAISTFLGVFMMVFAEFPYFTLYFFNMYCLTIFGGALNGLFVLPVLLSLIGPPTLTIDE